MSQKTKRILSVALALILLNLTFPPRSSNENGRALSRGFIFSDTSIVKNSVSDILKGFKTTYFYTASINLSVLYTQCAIIGVIASLVILSTKEEDQ